MYQHPLIPLILSLILLVVLIKQAISLRKFYKKRLLLAFLFVFVTALVLVFYPEIEANPKWLKLTNLGLLGIDVVIGFVLLIFSEYSRSKEQFNQALFKTLDEAKYYVLVDKKNRIKDISTLFLNDLGVTKEEVLKKNIFNVIELKYQIYSYNDQEAKIEDLKIYFNKNNIDKVSSQMDLGIHDDKGEISAYYFSVTPLYVFNKFKGRLFVGDKKSKENLVGMEKDLEESLNELELIKSRFVTILNNTEEGIFFLNITDSSLWLNDIIVKQLNLNSNSLTIEEFRNNIHQDDLALVKAKLSQVNNINPDYSLTYRYNIGASYVYVKEEGSRISNGKEVELCGRISLIQTSGYSKTQTDLDNVLGEPEMLAKCKSLFEQNKIFQIVFFRVESIPEINEKCGRSIGSMALSEYVKIIKNRYVDENMIYRLSGLDFVALVTDYRKMDMLKGALNNGEKILHVGAEYGTLNVKIEVKMGISCSNEASDYKKAINNSKEAFRFCSNPKYSASFAYYKDTL